ncbi:hypothetical protein [Ancylobacter mangrovi]|uniref:hypothetical protein n=1 Tax=Ancylobacter mangrovi TaxID=2972472 RepID=UPI0021635A4B|nr:hypothetical protein [Ancylobacter mangrovi]MCS0501629.1 hypothetical protein [Ancylobacter mangrovi]
MTINWPSSLKPSQITDPELVASYATGGRTSNGLEQRVLSDAGYWRLSYTFPIRTRQQVLAWRAMVSRMKAGEAVVATVYDMFLAGGALGALKGAVTGAAPAGATTLALMVRNLYLDEGVRFSIGDRMYQVTQVLAYHQADSIPDWLSTGAPWRDDGVWYDSPYLGLADVTISILPPLREAVVEGQFADFANLRLLCWPEDLSSIPLDLDLGKFADPTLTLVEAF